MDADIKMDDMEFDLNEIVDDVEMEDDELDKELREIEKENEMKLLQEKSSNCRNKEKSNSAERDNDKTSTDEHRKHHRTKHKDSEINDKNSDRHDDDQRSRSNDLHGHDDHDRQDDRKHRDGHGRLRKYVVKSCDMYEEQLIDYRRLNRSLHVTRQSEPMVIGREIAYRLHEPKTQLFGHVVRVLGFTMVSEIFAETKEIVRRGGIKTDNGDRMRSPGGTFLYIMKNRCYATPEQVKEIFKMDNESKKQAKKRKQVRDVKDNLDRVVSEHSKTEKRQKDSTKDRDKKSSETDSKITEAKSVNREKVVGNAELRKNIDVKPDIPSSSSQSSCQETAAKIECSSSSYELINKIQTKQDNGEFTSTSDRTMQRLEDREIAHPVDSSSIRHSNVENSKFGGLEGRTYNTSLDHSQLTDLEEGELISTAEEESATESFH